MVASCWLLFFRLGHYPLWCDEADTALYARGVVRSGDTSAMLDHNLYAIRNGTSLVELRGRYQPPAPFYLAAPFVGREGTGSFWPRAPFAICGVISVGLMLFWMRRDGASALLWVVLSAGIVCNVSLMLYFRQCRYYALATLLSLVAAYCYLHWDGRRRMLALFSVVAVLLLLTHYLAYAGLFVAVAVDYWLFQRTRRALSWREWALILVPQIVLGAIVVSIWNPVDKGVNPVANGGNGMSDRLKLVGWSLREINACEFGVGLLMLFSPAVYFIEKNRWLLRAWLAVLSYTLIVSILSPQPVALTRIADIRYLSALIPVCIFLTGLSIVVASRHRWSVALPLAAVAFGTTVFHYPLDWRSWRSTTYEWLTELASARPMSTQMAIDWANRYVRPGESIWVSPDHMAYPLMYHAPHALYAWQLGPPRRKQFEALPPIHFVGATPPDYILSFARRAPVENVIAAYAKMGVSYTPAAALDVHWDDAIRPELPWRAFRPVVGYDRALEGVYFWRRAEVVGRRQRGTDSAGR